MKISTENTKNCKPTPNLIHRLLSWITITIIGIAIEAYFREILYSWGLIIIKLIQDYIDDNFVLINLFRVFSFMAGTKICTLTLLIFFNYFDMYSSLVLFEIIACCAVGNGFLKLIYKNPRPFFHEDWVKAYDCETGYGNPSGHSITAIALYFTLWKIFKLKYNLNPKLKKLVLSMMWLLIISVLVSRLALGVHSLNQIILGSFFGYQILSLMFYVFNISLNLDEEITSLVNYRNRNILVASNFFLFSLGCILFNFFPYLTSLETNKYLENILESCPRTPYSKTFDFESYTMLSTFSLLPGAYLGILYDIKVNLNNNHYDWIEINKGLFRWNKTNFLKGILRILVMALILSIPLACNELISSHSHIHFIFVMKNFIPYFAISFCLFAFVRKACSTLKFTNHLTREKQS